MIDTLYEREHSWVFGVRRYYRPRERDMDRIHELLAPRIIAFLLTYRNDTDLEHELAAHLERCRVILEEQRRTPTAEEAESVRRVMKDLGCDEARALYIVRREYIDCFDVEGRPIGGKTLREVMIENGELKE
jgi:hypothetical protein